MQATRRKGICNFVSLKQSLIENSVVSLPCAPQTFLLRPWFDVIRGNRKSPLPLNLLGAGLSDSWRRAGLRTVTRGRCRRAFQRATRRLREGAWARADTVSPVSQMEAWGREVWRRQPAWRRAIGIPAPVLLPLLQRSSRCIHVSSIQVYSYIFKMYSWVWGKSTSCSRGGERELERYKCKARRASLLSMVLKYLHGNHQL